MASPLIGMAAINAIVFGIQGNVMRRLQPNSVLHKLNCSAFSGAFAGAVQTFICSPMELIKLRMQMQKEPVHFLHHERSYPGIVYSDPLDCIRKIKQQEGWLGLNRGYWITLYREVPAFALYFATYDALCEWRIYQTAGMKLDDLSVPFLCFAGGMSGISAWMLTYPVDVVKSRLQVDGMYGDYRYSGIADCFKKSYREVGGVKVFFKGLNSTLIRAFPVNAATFVTVTVMMRYMRREM